MSFIFQDQSQLIPILHFKSLCTYYFFFSCISQSDTLRLVAAIMDFASEEGIMMFNATFINISVISWWSVLLLEETGVPRENHRPFGSH